MAGGRRWSGRGAYGHVRDAGLRRRHDGRWAGRMMFLFLAERHSALPYDCGILLADVGNRCHNSLEYETQNPQD
jgi:hypothetical protein